MNTLILVIILLLLIMVYLIISGYLPKTFRIKESFSDGKELLFEGFKHFRKKIAEAIHPSEQSSLSERLLSSLTESKDSQIESNSIKDSSAKKSEEDSEENSDEDSEENSDEDSEEHLPEEINSTPPRTTPPLSYTLEELSKLSETPPPKQVTHSPPKISHTPQTPTQKLMTTTSTETPAYTKEKLFQMFQTFMLNYLPQNKQLESLSQAKTAPSYS